MVLSKVEASERWLEAPEFNEVKTPKEWIDGATALCDIVVFDSAPFKETLV